MLAEGFILGAAAGGTCAATCAPFLVPYLLAGGGPVSAGRRVLVFAEFMAGRLVAYLAAGIAVALTGRALDGFLHPRLAGSLLSAAGLALAVFSVLSLRSASRPCRGVPRGLRARGFAFLTGAVLGLNLCPPFVAALVRVGGIHDPAAASIFFLALFAGTTVYLLPAPAAAAFMGGPFFRRFGAYLGIIAGGWFAVQGALAWA